MQMRHETSQPLNMRAETVWKSLKPSKFAKAIESHILNLLYFEPLRASCKFKVVWCWDGDGWSILGGKTNIWWRRYKRAVATTCWYKIWCLFKRHGVALGCNSVNCSILWSALAGRAPVRTNVAAQHRFFEMMYAELWFEGTHVMQK